MLASRLRFPRVQQIGLSFRRDFWPCLFIYLSSLLLHITKHPRCIYLVRLLCSCWYGHNLRVINRFLCSAQLQVSSMSLPLRSIKHRKSSASSSDMSPTLIAAFFMAAFTAIGILFEDLAKMFQSMGGGHLSTGGDVDYPEIYTHPFLFPTTSQMCSASRSMRCCTYVLRTPSGPSRDAASW